MKRRPLPITVTPVPDELLSGWLSRLAASNHCEVADLLVHIGIDAKYAAALDHGIDMLHADMISVAARIDPAFVPSMTFAAMPEAEMRFTAQVSFQACTNCTDRGLELRHWRRAWAFDCQMCGARLLPKADRQNRAAVSAKLVHRARHGAGVLERIAMSGNVRQLRRAMRAVSFAMGLKALRGDPLFALQSPRPIIRLFCLAAIASAQSRPLVKAALCSMDIDVYARVALLRAYENEPRLLATIDQIAQRMRPRAGASATSSHI
jgi:putative hemolysin